MELTVTTNILDIPLLVRARHPLHLTFGTGHTSSRPTIEARAPTSYKLEAGPIGVGVDDGIDLYLLARDIPLP